MRAAVADRKFSLAFGPVVLAALVGAGLNAAVGRPSPAPAAPPPAPAVAAARPQAGDDVVPDIVDRITPAVVSIYFIARPTSPSPYHRFFPLNPLDVPPSPQQGLGSGVLASADGLILTNHHVVQKASDIHVVLADRREFRAKVVGSDAPTDVALLRIDAKDLPTIPFGDSSKVRVGQSVLAVGNSLGVGQTVSKGIVSAKARANVGIADYEDFLQTDAAINPGNSGGPLVNMKGEVIGINTAIASRTGGFQGIGFAIPINMAREVMDLLLKHGKVGRGQIGVVGQDMTPALARAMDGAPAQGVLISDVLEKSAAREAGLERGDVIVELDGQPVASVADLRNHVALRGAGAEVKLRIWRSGKTVDAKVRLHEPEARAEKPEEEALESEESAGSPSGLEGVSVTPASPELLRRAGLPRDGKGLVVMSVAATAAWSGLKAGDLVIEVDRRPVAGVSDMQKAVKESKSDSVLLTLRRREGVLFVSVPKK